MNDGHAARDAIIMNASMADDTKPQVLEYHSIMQTPKPPFKWRLYLGGIFAAFGSPCLAGLLISATAPGLQSDAGPAIAFGIIGTSIVVPLIFAIESLLHERRRAFGLGVFTAYGMTLLAIGMCFLWLR